MTARAALCAGVGALPRGPPGSEPVRGRRAALSIPEPDLRSLSLSLRLRRAALRPALPSLTRAVGSRREGCGAPAAAFGRAANWQRAASAESEPLSWRWRRGRAAAPARGGPGGGGAGAAPLIHAAEAGCGTRMPGQAPPPR